ncbi:MAG: bifunctional glyoxylate/hydroxypyruvate reductase B [Chloroflexi bacterium]|nr:bifunctional glyoxylate/hydroxypyruvate reductase B [Chloroflexota bacterium]
MAKTDCERQTKLILDESYQDAVAALADEFPTLQLVTQPAGQVQCLIAQAAPVDAALLDELPSLHTALKLGRSYSNFDMPALRQRGINFAFQPRKGPNCVAELALTLILALSKDLVNGHEAVAMGAYRYRGLTPELTSQRKIAFHWMKNQRVHEVSGKTLGIIGMGEISCELARRASVLGMRNIYYKRSPLSPELEAAFDASYAPLDELLQESDYVCVAVPHTAETERMIGARQLELMKPSAYLVNIARGGILDEEALIDALVENRIAGAGLDVFTFEPLPTESPLTALDNVILCPHIGGGTGTTREIELRGGLEKLCAALA